MEENESAARSGRKPSQAQKSDRMRKEIVQAAISCIYECGYHRASIKKIAERSSFSQGALQHHFPCKEDLMVHVLERVLNKSVRLTCEWAAAVTSKTDVISELTKELWQNQMRSPEYLAMLEILVAARTEATLKERLAPIFREYTRSIEECIRRVFQQHDLPVDQAKPVAMLSRCMMSGLISNDVLFLEDEEQEEYVQQWSVLVEASCSSSPKNNARL